MVTFAEITEAYGRIRSVIVKTSVLTSSALDQVTGGTVYLKCENLQLAGAFKFRGAYNALSLLSPRERKRGVITHSSGNHAQALALAASMLRVKATIVMPHDASPAKLAATRQYGANVVLCGPTLEDRVQVTNDLIVQHNYVLIHPYDNAHVIAGNGTAALELVEEVGKLDYVFAPVGGGGLLSGTATAMKTLCPDAAVIGVEPANADDAYRSFKTGKLVPSINPTTIADGLRTSLSELTFSLIRKHVDDIITVSESEIVDAMRFLWDRMKLVVEPSGAVSLAGLLKLRGHLRNRRAGVIISGGNVDLDRFFEQYTTSPDSGS
jgi:threonine dehydratase